MNSKLHLAFLFASPLVTKCDVNGVEKMEHVTKIDHKREFQTVLKSLKSTGNSIKYRKIPATNHNFLTILREGTLALHFSGHGAKNNEENFSRARNPNAVNKGDMLMFEDEDGVASYITEQDLKNYLEKSEI